MAVHFEKALKCQPVAASTHRPWWFWCWLSVENSTVQKWRVIYTGKEAFKNPSLKQNLFIRLTILSVSLSLLWSISKSLCTRSFLIFSELPQGSGWAVALFKKVFELYKHLTLFLDNLIVFFFLVIIPTEIRRSQNIRKWVMEWYQRLYVTGESCRFHVQLGWYPYQILLFWFIWLTNGMYSLLKNTTIYCSENPVWKEVICTLLNKY